MNYGGLSPGKGALHCHGAFGRIDSEQKDTTMNQATSISSLLVNQLKHPFGVETPSFSWKLASARQGAAQAAYRIRVFAGREGAGAPVWDSGEVASGDAIAIRYGGAALKPASAYSWTVAVKDETGAWTESAPAVFETALTDKAAWAKADWISVDDPARGDRDTAAFLKQVANGKAVREAWWFVTGLGVFEAYVNGEPVSHLRGCGTRVRDALKPGFTHCGKRRHYFSYDVTHLFKTGAGETNTLSALVTEGWWRDQITGHCGKESAFRAVLVLRYDDGSEDIVGTDNSWRAFYGGPVMKAEIFYGEDYDARFAADWNAWASGAAKIPDDLKPARVNTEFIGETVPLKGLSIRQRDDIALAPVSIRVWSGIEGADADHYGRVRVVREYRDGDELKVYPGENLQFDFGQNAAAVPDFVFSAARDTALTVRVSEMLNDGDGAFSRKNDGPEGELYKRNYRDARSEAHYTFVGAEEETYRPSFTFFGYRYLSIAATNVVTVRRVRSVPVTSVHKCAETGSIETAVPILNRLVANGVWGQRSNYLSVPTDCPQRNERLGWAADTQVFTPTACYNANVYSFLSKWMDDMADSQHPDGGYPGVAPLAQYGSNNAAVGWADAGIIVPHVLWRMFGDTSVIDDHWDSMVRYLDRLDRHEGPNPEPWGEWLAYERNDHEIKCYLASAFWVWDALMMRQMAAATGRKADEARFADSEAKARAAFKAKYLDEKGEILPTYKCQAAAVYALYLDLVEGGAYEATKADLLANIKAHGDCLQTGFLGTAILLNALAKAGAADVAYTLLLQRKNPSWLYSIDQGATTFWERWNSYTKESGFGDAHMNSFNHYAYGAVVSWMYAAMAGIREDLAAPGFRHFFLQPLPDPRVPSVKASYDSAGGLIESAWEYGPDGKWTWTYTIPANTTATVILPDGRAFERKAGTYTEKSREAASARG